jgi:hypothetical protein
MFNETSIEKLRQADLERANKQTKLKDKLAQRPNFPQERDIFRYSGTRWVILRQNEQNPELLLTVPADDNPLVGSSDIKLPYSALCSPLTLRCQESLLIHKNQFKLWQRVGLVEKWHWYRALDKLKQLQTGKLRSSALQQETDDDPEYVEWMTQVTQSKAALEQALVTPKKASLLEQFVLRLKAVVEPSPLILIPEMALALGGNSSMTNYYQLDKLRLGILAHEDKHIIELQIEWQDNKQVNFILLEDEIPLQKQKASKQAKFIFDPSYTHTLIIQQASGEELYRLPLEEIILN